MQIDRNFIEYVGINAPMCGTDNVLTFKEFNISEMLELPICLCDISNILKAAVSVNITNKQIFKTPIATSAEGQSLTGLKIGIEGEIDTKLTYIEDSAPKSINVLNYKSKFYVSTPIPDYIKNINSLLINVYVENINVQKVDDDMLSENLVLLLTIE